MGFTNRQAAVHSTRIHSFFPQWDSGSSSFIIRCTLDSVDLTTDAEINGHIKAKHGSEIPTASRLITLVTSATHFSTNDEQHIIADTTSNDVTVTLPSALPAAISEGTLFSITRITAGPNSLRVNPIEDQFINDDDRLFIKRQFSSVDFMTYDGNWLII